MQTDQELIKNLQAERDGLREALRDIAAQQLTVEIEPLDGEVSGDFEGAYDTMINVARAALATNSPKKGNE